MSLSQIELVWVSVRVERECFWVYLREDDKVFESKMAVSESKMAEFKMAAIIKLSQNDWVKFFFVQNGWIQDGRIQVGCNYEIELEWTCEVFLCKMAESKMAEFKIGCHHQFGWEWMSLSHIELVWVRVRVEEEFFEWIWEKITRCLNPRWQCLNPTWQNSRWLPSSSWVRMNEWSSFCVKWLNPRWQNSRWLPSSS